ncbi:MAG: hypothetical protein WCG27_11085 [Pseudomonadota bacterium]
MSAFHLRKNLRPEIRGKENPQFTLDLSGHFLMIKFNSRVILNIYSGNKCFFAGNLIQFSSPTQIEIGLPLNDTSIVSDRRGNNWEIGVQCDRYSFKEIIQEYFQHYYPLVKSTVKSCIVHLGLILLFVGIYFLAQYSKDIAKLLGHQTQVIVSMQQAIRASVAPEPFSGIGLQQFTNAWESEHHPGAQAQKVVKSVANLMNSISNSLKDTSAGTSPVGLANRPEVSIDTKALIAEALKDSRQRDRQNSINQTKSKDVPLEAEGPRYDYQEFLIRQTISQLRPQLGQVYSEALRIDPTLSVSITYEGKIDSNGKLTQIILTPKGTGAAAAIAHLKKSVQQILEGAVFPKDCAKLPLRGEQIFVR